MNNVIPLPGRSAEPTEANPGHGREASVTPIETVSYTVAEVADMLRLSMPTTYAMVRNGDIPARRAGRLWLIPKRRFHAWLNDLPEATDAEVAQALGIETGECR